MNLPLKFTRFFFFGLSILFMTAFMVTGSTKSLPSNLLIGILSGAFIGFSLIGLEYLFRKFELRVLLTTMLGLFLGYLIGQSFLLVFQAFIDLSSIALHISPQALEIARTVILLCSLYLGSIMTLKASENLAFSIPFLKLTPSSRKIRKLLIDASTIADPRIIDLCTTGLFDHQLILPKFLIKELMVQSESSDEVIKTKARKSLETAKKLEKIPELNLEYVETDVPELKDLSLKIFRLAKMLDCNVLTADAARVQTSSGEEIKTINIHHLSNLLKPMMQAGEIIKIKIQRYGKEPKQGVGYLDDGTMVVVNGGGDSLGEIIEAQVLSIKHSHSGRMIFCNACEQEIYAHEFENEMVED